MGSNFCGFRYASSNGLSKQNSDDKNGGITASVLEFMKPRCLWAASKIKKKQSHRHESQPKQQKQQLMNTCKVLTLEEWILSSPGFNVSKQSSSNRIHPSFGGDDHEDLDSANALAAVGQGTANLSCVVEVANR
ncbi:uncharacterized protein Fot_39787 [Forsythia ovata]|uniref:Uncharacterized protein n=1 Tax=Forsythia ovata TaxID=205694 RepID=A0ABD1S5B4_9LAMI